jgi:hypothetical protein
MQYLDFGSGTVDGFGVVREARKGLLRVDEVYIRKEVERPDKGRGLSGMRASQVERMREINFDLSSLDVAPRADVEDCRVNANINFGPSPLLENPVVSSKLCSHREVIKVVKWKNYKKFNNILRKIVML